MLAPDLEEIFLLAIISVFIASLMVGRTPEDLGEKIEAREMKFAMLSLLLAPRLCSYFRRRRSV